MIAAAVEIDEKGRGRRYAIWSHQEKAAVTSLKDLAGINVHELQPPCGTASCPCGPTVFCDKRSCCGLVSLQQTGIEMIPGFDLVSIKIPVIMI